MRPSSMSALLPLLAAMFVIIWGGGTGVIFILLSKTALHEWGSVIVGMSLVVGIPFLGAVLTLPRR